MKDLEQVKGDYIMKLKKTMVTLAAVTALLAVFAACDSDTPITTLNNEVQTPVTASVTTAKPLATSAVVTTEEKKPAVSPDKVEDVTAMTGEYPILPPPKDADK